MDRRPLGRTGLCVTPLGVGGGHFPSDAAAEETVHCWFKHGINYVDTSPAYAGGASEKRLGLALRDIPRESYVLQSKCCDEGPQNGGHSPFSNAGVLASAQNSLKALQTSFLDVLLLHDPYPQELDAFLAPGGGMEAIHELKQSGIIKHFGLGAREHEPHMRLMERGDLEVSITVDDYNLMRRYVEPTLLPAASAAGVAIINASPLYRGLLVNEPSEIYGNSRMTKAHPELTELAASMRSWAEGRGGGLKLLDLAVQLPMANMGITSSLYGCVSAAQVDEIVAAAQKTLPEGTLADFEQAFGEKIRCFPADRHFYWFKKQSPGCIEWPEMAGYPRDLWGAALADGPNKKPSL